MKMAMVIRHPCAVIQSRMSLGWEPAMAAFLEQPQLMEDHLRPFEDAIRRADSPFEQQLLRWCVQHFVPLRDLGADSIPIFFYEDFCVAPREWFPPLLAHFGLPAPGERFFARLATPSRLSRSESTIRTTSDGMQLATKWRESIAPAALEQTYITLRRFGLDGLYGDDGLPRPQAIRHAVAATRAIL